MSEEPEQQPKEKSFRRAAEDPWVEVMGYPSVTHSYTADGKPIPYSFRASRIDHLEDPGEGESVIVLQNEAAFTLCLPYAQLVEQLEGGYSPIDLKAFDPQSKKKPVSAVKKEGVMPDGTLYVGQSPDTHEAMCVSPTDERGRLTWDEAVFRAQQKSQETGYKYRLPSKAELSLIFNNHATDVGINTQPGSYPAGWYWTSTLRPPTENFEILRLCDEKTVGSCAPKNLPHLVRLVRS